jgi:methionine--tRNA ligase beta chain
MKNITFKDFQRLDMRVGTVVSAEVPKWSHWVMKLTVNLGNPPVGGGKRTVFAGIMKFYKPEDLEGKQFVFVTNLEHKKIGPEGDFSEAMVLAASVPAKSGKDPASGGAGEDEKPVLLSVSEKVPNGTKVR